MLCWHVCFEYVHTECIVFIDLCVFIFLHRSFLVAVFPRPFFVYVCLCSVSSHSFYFVQFHSVSLLSRCCLDAYGLWPAGSLSDSVRGRSASRSVGRYCRCVCTQTEEFRIPYCCVTDWLTDWSYENYVSTASHLTQLFVSNKFLSSVTYCLISLHSKDCPCWNHAQGWGFTDTVDGVNQKHARLGNFTICTPHEMLFGWRTGGLDGRCMRCICERRTEFWWINLKERRHLEDLGIDGRKILKCISNIRDGRGLD